MKKIIVAAAGMLAMEVAVAGGAAVVSTDFSGAAVPDGWWVENGEYRSPTYSGAVDKIVMQYSSGDARDDMTVHAFTEEGVSSHVATFTGASSAASFDFPETTDFRSFRLVSTNNLALFSFTAFVAASSLDAPAAVAVSNNITGTSFDAYWSAVEGATGYKVYVWTNAVVGASAGTPIWEETFANAPARTTTVNFRDDFTDNGTTGWTYEKAYASVSNGAVRIGTTSDKGILVSPPLPAFSETQLAIRITAWRQTTSEGTDMPLGIVSGDVTNIVGVVAIGDESATYSVALPGLNAGDRVAIFSPTNKASARAIIDDVAILSGYSDGHLEPAYIVDGIDVGAVTKYSFADLPSVPVLFAVEAYGRRGASSEKTEAVEVDLANPEKAAVLNACPLSSLDENTYMQNFDSLAALTATTGDKDWLNGTTLQYWQAYKNAEAETSFNYNGGAGTIGGIYALSGNRGDTVRALGAYSTKDNEYSFGLAFTNDTESTVILSSVSYLAQQWGFKNDTNQTMSVSAKVVDAIDWISAHGDGWMEFGLTQSVVYGEGVAHDTPVSTSVEAVPLEAISIAPGQILMLKWRVHSLKAGKPGMMGIDDVTVTFGVVEKPQGFAIRLAHN